MEIGSYSSLEVFVLIGKCNRSVLQDATEPQSVPRERDWAQGPMCAAECPAYHLFSSGVLFLRWTGPKSGTNGLSFVIPAPGTASEGRGRFTGERCCSRVFFGSVFSEKCLSWFHYSTASHVKAFVEHVGVYQ